MSHRHMRASAMGVLVALTVTAVAAGLVRGHGHTHAVPVGGSASMELPSAHASPNKAEASPSNRPLLAAIHAFASAYGRYLDGGPALIVRDKGSVTAASQATQTGRIPKTFRDGPVAVAQLDALESTCCSASITVVLANREERYPFSEQLLLERGGWVVDQITPPDLSMDQNVRPAPDASIPSTGSAAAKAFAVSYASYRSGESSTHPAMTEAAAKQIVAGTDSLADQRLPKQAGRLTAIRFGPPSGEEFAATVTVRVGKTRVTFSFLMVKTASGWKCGQFL